MASLADTSSLSTISGVSSDGAVGGTVLLRVRDHVITTLGLISASLDDPMWWIVVETTLLLLQVLSIPLDARLRTGPLSGAADVLTYVSGSVVGIQRVSDFITRMAIIGSLYFITLVVGILTVLLKSSGRFSALARTIRVLAVTLGGALYLPVLNTALPMLDCVRSSAAEAFAIDTGFRVSTVAGPSTTQVVRSVVDNNDIQMECFQSVHVILLIFSVIVIAVATATMILVRISLFPTQRDAVRTRLHARTDLAINIAVLIMALLVSIVGDHVVSYVAVAILPIACYSLSVYYLQFTNMKMNYVYGVICGLWMWIGIWVASGAGDLAVLIVGAISFAFSTPYVVQARFLRVCIYPPVGDVFHGSFGERTAHLQLLLPADVDVATRFFLTRTGDVDAQQHAFHIYQKGILLFPKSSLVRMSWVSFLTRYTNYVQLAAQEATALERLVGGLEVRLFLERMRGGRQWRSSHGEKIALSQVDFSGSMTRAFSYHRRVSGYVSWLWTVLASETLRSEQQTLRDLSGVFGKISKGERRGSSLYLRLLKRHRKKPSLWRSLGNFLFRVRNLPVLASSCFELADQLERQLATARGRDGRLFDLGRPIATYSVAVESAIQRVKDNQAAPNDDDDDDDDDGSQQGVSGGPHVPDSQRAHGDDSSVVGRGSIVWRKEMEFAASSQMLLRERMRPKVHRQR